MQRSSIIIIVILLLTYCMCANKQSTSYFSHPSQDTQLYYFYMPTCPHCIRFSPEWDRVEEYSTFKSNVSTSRVDVNKSPVLANKFNVRTVPAVVKTTGAASTVYTGNMTASDIIAWI